MSQRKTTEEYFDEFISELMEAGVKKMSQYGTSWTSYHPDSLMTRMLNKGKRAVTLIETKENLVGEKLSGEFKEILNYGTLLAMQLENSIELHAELDPEQVTIYRQKAFEEAKKLMIKKNHDYGEAWRDMSQLHITDEINVKIRRMRTVYELTQKPSMDNIYDVMNYCSFELILLEEGVHQDI